MAKIMAICGLSIFSPILLRRCPIKQTKYITLNFLNKFNLWVIMCGGDQSGAYRCGYGSMAQIMTICGLFIFSLILLGRCPNKQTKYITLNFLNKFKLWVIMCGGDHGGAYRRGYGSMAQIMAICGLSIQRHFVLNTI